MKPDLINLILVCLYISIYPGLVESYRKCCPTGSNLNYWLSCIENHCKESTSLSSILANSTDIRIESTQDGIGFPTSCTKLERLNFSNLFSITKSDGKDLLRTSKYKEPIHEENFCIDTIGEEIYAATCDQCDGKLCINLCCPFGQKLKDFGSGDNSLYDMNNATEDSYDFEEFDKNPCEPIDTTILQINYQLDFIDGEVAATNFKLGVDYVLVGPLHKEYHSNETIFECPYYQTRKVPSIWLDIDTHESRELSLSTEGVLSGVVDHLSLKNSTKPVNFIDVPTDSFCVGLKQESEESGDQVLKVRFQNCKFDIQDMQDQVFYLQDELCWNVERTVESIGCFVSLFFVIVAIIAHLFGPQTQPDSTYGKICMMYLTNLLLLIIMRRIYLFSEHVPGTLECEIIGYLLQYVNLSITCCASAVMIFVFFNLKGLNPRTSSENYKMFYGLCAYAQGFPLLICSITAIVDAVRKYQKICSRDAWIYPEMGVHICYVGFRWTESVISPEFYQTPDFLYVTMYQLLIVIANLWMFIKTAIYILETRQLSRNGHEAYYKENFRILGKLFVLCSLMLCVFILYVVTAGIGISCPVRLVLYLPWAFHGLITILFLVCLDNPIGRFYIIIMKKVKVALSLKMWSLVRTASELFSQGDSGISTNANNIETMTVPETNLEGVDNITLDNIP